MNRLAYGQIAAGAVLWGLIGIFVQGLHDLGLTSLQIVSLRFASAAVIMVAIILLSDRSLLRIDPKDSLYFVGTGIFSVAFFNWCYFETMQETSLAVAAILLYTAPAFVTLISYMVFRESLTKRKLLSLLVTFVGCVFVAGYITDTGTSISTLGLLTGIGSGFGYALYSIFGKSALKKYHHMTIAAYTFLFASIAMLPISGFTDPIELFLDSEVWYYTLALGFFPTVLAYILYTKGLSHVESSRASITATIEPVVAACIGVFMFGEILSTWQMTGIVLVIMAVIIVQGKDKEKSKGDLEKN